MAALHTNKEVVISVDIKDFFHSIKQSRLIEIFQNIGIGEKPARTISELCTYKAFVPQGALTSPKIANIVTAYSFGPALKAYCETIPGLTMTIYADDVTISSTNPEVNSSEILSAISTIIRDAGFRINHEKSKIMRKAGRQYVCGVVVNSKTNMIKKERYRLRAIVHNITKNGLEEEAVKSQMDAGTFSSHIKGKLNWLKQLNTDLGVKNGTKLDEYLVGLRTEPNLIGTTGPQPIEESKEIEKTDEELLAEIPW
jgi:RNA-directed DNA polymerase